MIYTRFSLAATALLLVLALPVIVAAMVVASVVLSIGICGVALYGCCAAFFDPL